MRADSPGGNRGRQETSTTEVTPRVTGQCSLCLADRQDQPSPVAEFCLACYRDLIAGFRRRRGAPTGVAR
jgi:hypothetical protein